jgi:hypothetical protein
MQIKLVNDYLYSFTTNNLYFFLKFNKLTVIDLILIKFSLIINFKHFHIIKH